MPTTITHRTYTVGRATYRTQNDTDTLSAILSVKPARKPRSRVDRRAYPKFREGTSTANYVRAYFRLQTERNGFRYVGAQVYAYADHLDHVALYQPLSTAAQYTVIIDGVEEPSA